MKIIAYGARVDEIDYLNQWGQTSGHELTIRTELLTEDTIHLAQGYDGINCLQTTPYSAAMFEKNGRIWNQIFDHSQRRHRQH
nr:hypothetical protein [Lacticaseibacillus manihotivorans]